MRQRVTSLRFLLSFALPHHSTHPSTALTPFPSAPPSPSPLFSDPAVLARRSSLFNLRPYSPPFHPLLAPIFSSLSRSSDKPFPRFASFLSAPPRPSVHQPFSLPPFIRFSLSIHSFHLLLHLRRRDLPFPSLYPLSLVTPPPSPPTTSYSLYHRSHLFSDSRYSLRFLSASSLPHSLTLSVYSLHLPSCFPLFLSLPPLSLSLHLSIYLSIRYSSSFSRFLFRVAPLHTDHPTHSSPISPSNRPRALFLHLPSPPKSKPPPRSGTPTQI